jgi:cell division protein ZapA (FtsZ GTPase activity inhibitor)
MDKFFITVRVADREYRLNIERKHEALVREVVKKINDDLRKYAESYEFKDTQDLLAMVVLQNAIGNKHLDIQLNFQQDKLSEKLEDIDRVLTEHLTNEVQPTFFEKRR